MGQWAEASQAGLITRVEGTDSLPHIAFRHPIKYTVLVSWHWHGSRVASTCLLSDLSTFVSKPLSGNELPSNFVPGREEDTKTSKRKNSLSLKTTKKTKLCLQTLLLFIPWYKKCTQWEEKKKLSHRKFMHGNRAQWRAPVECFQFSSGVSVYCEQPVWRCLFSSVAACSFIWKS